MKATARPTKKTKKAKQAKEESKPKRSLNVYNIFFAIKRKKIPDDNTKVGFANLARTVSKHWKKWLHVFNPNSFCYGSRPATMVPVPCCEHVMENISPNGFNGFTMNHLDERIRALFASTT
jgi:hypothetical protein